MRERRDENLAGRPAWPASRARAPREKIRPEPARARRTCGAHQRACGPVRVRGRGREGPRRGRAGARAGRSGTGAHCARGGSDAEEERAALTGREETRGGGPVDSKSLEFCLEVDRKSLR